MLLKELTNYCDQLLRCSEFKDYCPNGLQVEGDKTINRIIGGVTASQALLNAAVAKNANAILVHHGYFWKSENAAIAGIKRDRIATLIKHNISLIAYHLPLDAHPEYGNNAQLGKVLGVEQCEPVSRDSLIWRGKLKNSTSSRELKKHIANALGREPTYIEATDGLVRNVMWCTGAAQSYFEQATSLGADAYITGEISEQNFHHAHETKVDFIAAGHHATERYGVSALGKHIATSFNVEFEFVDIENPI